MIAEPAWEASEIDAVATIRDAANAALTNRVQGDLFELSVLLCDDAKIQGLNRDFRDRDEPTDILSFPALEDAPIAGIPAPLGDIIIAHETASCDAQAHGKTLKDHLAHLTVHGCLHLIGYDHIGDADAAAMESLEKTILAALGISDPYALA